MMGSDPVNTPRENVQFLWNTLNEKYPFFEFKGINWDSVGNRWLPRVSDTMNDIQVFRIIDSMLYSLRDGHTNLYGAFNFSRNWEWYLGYPDNFDTELLERNYYKGQQWFSGALVNRFLDSNRVGYMRYGSFSSTVSDFAIDLVVSRFRDTRGLIIDVRSNGGGALANVDKLVSRFINKDLVAWKEAEKKDKGRRDLTEFKPYTIRPEGERKYLKPIIILTNRRCYSATTLFVTAMKNLPNVKIIGDWTGGGGGTPTSTQLPNGWVVRYSGTVTLANDGLNIEDGVPPTIKQDLSQMMS
ncbi:MAG: S41 family peptidase [Saprospiraceae bacterium]|nr:S41 family peptidase [Saprospiraceae bacterium]